MITNIIVFFFSIITLVAGLTCLMVSYRREFEVPYRYRNTFPYELNFLKSNPLVVTGKIFTALSFAGLIAFFITYPGDRSDLNVIYVIAAFISVFGILSVIALIAVGLLNMKNVKYHLIGDTFFFAFVFILTIAISVMGFWTLRNEAALEIDIKKIVCSSIGVIITFLLAALLFNPRLKNWGKLEEKGEENGSMVYERPKWFVLAYTEWAFILALYIDAAILFAMFI